MFEEKMSEKNFRILAPGFPLFFQLCREDALSLEKKAGTTLEEEGHGEAHGAVCPDQVGCVPGGVQEEGWFDGCEIEHRTEGGHRL